MFLTQYFKLVTNTLRVIHKFKILSFDNTEKVFSEQSNSLERGYYTFSDAFDYDEIVYIKYDLVNKFDLSVYGPSRRGFLSDVPKPGKISYRVKDSSSVVFDDVVVGKITKLILHPRKYYHFKDSYFTYDELNDEWSCYEGRIRLKIDRLAIDPDAIRKILSCAMLIFSGFLDLKDFGDFINNFVAEVDIQCSLHVNRCLFIHLRPKLRPVSGTNLIRPSPT